MKSITLLATFAKMANTQSSSSLKDLVINNHQTKLYLMFEDKTLIADDALNALRKELKDMEKEKTPTILKIRKRDEIKEYIEKKFDAIEKYYAANDFTKEAPGKYRIKFKILAWPDSKLIGNLSGSSFERNNIPAIPASSFSHIVIDSDTLYGVDDKYFDILTFDQLTKTAQASVNKMFPDGIDKDSFFILDVKEAGFEVTRPYKNYKGEYYILPELHLVLESFDQRYKGGSELVSYNDLTDKMMQRNDGIIAKKLK